MPVAVSIDNMVSAVRREIGFRQRVYPRWVSQGKMKAETSAVEIERMEAVLEALEELRYARAFLAVGASQVLGAEAIHAWKSWAAFRGRLTHGAHAEASDG